MSNSLRTTLLGFCAAGTLLWILAWGPLHARTDRSQTVYFWAGFMAFRAPIRPILRLEIPFVVGIRARTGRSTSFYLNPLCLALIAALPLAVRRRARIRRRRLLRRGLCPACGYDLRGTPDRCPECGLDRPAMLQQAGLSPIEGMVRMSSVLSDHVVLGSLALCMLAFLAWNLSFTLLKGDHHGVGPLLLADGKLWIGPLYRGGEEAIRSEGWNVGVASWTRSEGVWGGRWTSFSLDLWPVVVLTAAVAIIRFRRIQRGVTKGTQDITTASSPPFHATP